MKKLVSRLVIFLLVFFIWSYYRLDGFQIYKVVNNYSDNFIPSEKGFKEIKKILNQKFSYLAKGHQCFVFVSEDNEYVIKLLNQDRFRLPWQVKYFSFIPILNKLKHDRFLRKIPSINSYLIANDQLKDETCILHVKMEGKNAFHQIICIKDKTGREYEIDLFDVNFVLQKKAIPIYPYLTKFYKKDQVKFKAAISSFLKIVSSRIKKNISDDDLDIEINYGFINGKAALIDPGRLSFDKNLLHIKNQKSEMIKSTKNFRKWIKNNYPDMLNFFDETLITLLDKDSPEDI